MSFIKNKREKRFQLTITDTKKLRISLFRVAVDLFDTHFKKTKECDFGNEICWIVKFY